MAQMKANRTQPTARTPVSAVAHYEHLSSLIQSEDLLFMNHGYAKLRGPNEAAWLRREDRKHLYHAQFLEQLVGRRSLSASDVLEVGSGRGGNCRLLTRYFEPRSVIGLDFSKENIRFCHRVHRDEGVHFVHGDAMSLPFRSRSFDTVLNIESSHCYPNLLQFFDETWRVLRPGGMFLYADCMAPGADDRISNLLERVGFEIQKARDIRRNVAAALEANELTMRRIMQRAVGKPGASEFGLRVWRDIIGQILPDYRAKRLGYSLWALKKPR